MAAGSVAVYTVEFYLWTGGVPPARLPYLVAVRQPAHSCGVITLYTRAPRA
jgi:hypothetical protein